MVTLRAAGILPAFAFPGRSKRARNPFRMIDFRKYNKTKDLKRDYVLETRS